MAQEVPERQFAESWEDMLGEYHGKVTWGNTKLLPRPPRLAADKYWSSRLVILFLQFAVIWFFSVILGADCPLPLSSPMSTRFEPLDFLSQVSSSTK